MLRINWILFFFLTLQLILYFNMDYVKRGVEVLNPGVVRFPVSCKTGEGMSDWADWLVKQVKNRNE